MHGTERNITYNETPMRKESIGYFRQISLPLYGKL